MPQSKSKDWDAWAATWSVVKASTAEAPCVLADSASAENGGGGGTVRARTEPLRSVISETGKKYMLG